MNPTVNIISAMASNRVIGTRDGMPWKVEEEYRQYLGFIQDQTVIMGRKSYEIFGPDLTSRHNLVISRSMQDGENYQVVRSLSEAIETAKGLGQNIFVAGGASIYALAVPIVDEMYLSFIKGDFEGIAYFPEFDENEWEMIEQHNHERFDFIRYKRKD